MANRATRVFGLLRDVLSVRRGFAAAGKAEALTRLGCGAGGTCVLALALAAGSSSGDRPISAAAPPVTLAACAAGIRLPVSSGAAPRLVAQVKHYEKQGMTFSANSTAEGAIQVDARSGDFGFRKRVFQDGRFDVELEAGPDKVQLAAVDGGVKVTRGQTALTLGPESTEEDFNGVHRLLADSRAVLKLRTKGAEFESAGEDSAAAASLLLADGLVGALTGDVGAPRRVARLLSQKARTQLRAAQSRPNTCYYQWEQSVIWAFIDYEDCAFIYKYPMLMCAVRWNLQAESAWFSFISCTGFGF